MSDNNGSGDAVVIERTLKAPVELVWQMWTKPEHFQSWYGPTGASIPVAEMDVSVGGKRRICMAMQTPNGEMKMWFVGEYREVSPTDRLIFTESMADEKGNIIPPSAMGMPEGHPEVTEITVQLEATTGGTKMVMTHAGIPAGSPGEAGWKMAFDKLADYVVSVAAR